MDNRNKSQKKINWNKVFFVLLASFSIIFVILVLRYRLTYHPPTEVYNENTRISFVWDGKTYEGQYSGDFANTKPNGKGLFTSDDGSLSYEGQWVMGLFSGEGKITYQGDNKDLMYEEGTFLDGKRDGRVRAYESESVYTETIYDQNIPYARSDRYENGELTDSDYYINATKMSDMISESKELTDKVIADKEYYNCYVSVKGKVEFVAQDDEKCYFRIDSDKVGMVFGSYENTGGITSMQAYMPNMKVGDEVTLYGYYIGVNKDYVLADKEGYNYEYIELMPFLGTDSNTNKELNNSDTSSYDDIIHNPYYRTMEETDEVFVVKDVAKAGKTYKLIASKKSSYKKNTEKYVLEYEGEPEEIFIAGDEITIKGYYDGQTKVIADKDLVRHNSYNYSKTKIETFEYDIYPLIKVEELVK